MDKLLIGVFYTEQDVKIAIRNEAPDILIGEAFADLTETLNSMRPEALKVATEILEDIKNVKE